MLGNNLERQRLRNVWQVVNVFANNNGQRKDGLKNEVDSLGSMVMANGLLQAIVMKFANMPKDNIRKDAAKCIVEAMCKWLKEKEPSKTVLAINHDDSQETDLNLVFLRLMDMDDLVQYQLVELEAISWLEQLKLATKMKAALPENKDPEENLEQNNVS